MSSFVIGVIAGFAAICGVAIGIQTISTPRTPDGVFASCELADLAKAGQLFRISGQNDWMSARGDIYDLSHCPTLRSTLVAHSS